MTTPRAAVGLRRYVPISVCLASYQQSAQVPDIIALRTVWVLIPGRAASDAGG